MLMEAKHNGSASRKWLHSSVSIVTEIFKFVPVTPLSSCDGIPYMLHIMLLSFSSCTPLLISKTYEIPFSQTNDFSGINLCFAYRQYVTYFVKVNIITDYMHSYSSSLLLPAKRKNYNERLIPRVLLFSMSFLEYVSTTKI